MNMLALGENELVNLIRKSFAENTPLPSALHNEALKIYMDTYNPPYAIKLSQKNFGFEDNKKIVPLYAAFCI